MIETRECRICHNIFDLNESNFYLYNRKGKKNDNRYIFFDKRCLECLRNQVNERSRRLNKGILQRRNEKYLFSLIKTSIRLNPEKNEYFETENDILESIYLKEILSNLKITDITETELKLINSDYEKFINKVG